MVATAAIFAPSFFMVLATVPYFDRLQRLSWFRRALRGILASFVGLLLAVTVRFGVAVPWSLPAALLAAAAFAALRFKIAVVWVVLVGGVLAAFIL